LHCHPIERVVASLTLTETSTDDGVRGGVLRARKSWLIQSSCGKHSHSRTERLSKSERPKSRDPDEKIRGWWDKARASKNKKYFRSTGCDFKLGVRAAASSTETEGQGGYAALQSKKRTERETIEDIF